MTPDQREVAGRFNQAAELLRDRARKATPGVWKLWGMEVLGDVRGDGDVDHALSVCSAASPTTTDIRTFNADYICAMQPRVAYALADWLDMIVHEAEEWGVTISVWNGGLDLVDTILGSP
jgi:hypothetical protein